MFAGPSWAAVAAVAVGSALGGVLRYLCSVWLPLWLGSRFPWSTLLVNVAGSAAIGVVAALSGDAASGLRWHPVVRQAMMAGVLGGFTTFASFSLETVVLARLGWSGAALLNAVLSVALSIGACACGLAVGRSLLR